MTGMPNGAPGYAPERERRSLSAGWIAFIIIDIVLVLGVIIYGVIVLKGPEPNDDRPAVSAAPPTQSESPSEEPATEPSQDEEPSSEETTAEEDSVVRFASPSGNIECAISKDSARCTIAELNKKPKKVDGCDGTVGYVLVVSADGVDKPCTAKEDQPSPADAGVQVLDYGSKVSENGFTCVSEADGMGCTHDETDAGFTLAKAGPRTF